MVALQAGVLADQDPEPLHQLRIQLRRLAVLLQQFEPALRLPDGVSSTRVAKIGRRLGLARDLDVLRDRLEHQLMPGLPEAELNALKPMRKQLRRERRLAFSEVVEDLRGRRYLKLLARLQAWLRDPQFTPLASEALEPWLPEFHTQLTGDLFLLPGWRSEVSDELHALRKRIKHVQYAARYMDDVGVSVSDAKVRVKRFVLDEPERKVTLLTICNREGVVGANVEVALDALGPVCEAAVAVIADHVKGLDVNGSATHASFTAPTAKLSAVLLVHRGKDVIRGAREATQIPPLSEKATF